MKKIATKLISPSKEEVEEFRRKLDEAKNSDEAEKICVEFNKRLRELNPEP